VHPPQSFLCAQERAERFAPPPWSSPQPPFGLTLSLDPQKSVHRHRDTNLDLPTPLCTPSVPKLILTPKEFPLPFHDLQKLSSLPRLPSVTQIRLYGIPGTVSSGPLPLHTTPDPTPGSNLNNGPVYKYCLKIGSFLTPYFMEVDRSSYKKRMRGKTPQRALLSPSFTFLRNSFVRAAKCKSYFDAELQRLPPGLGVAR